MKLLELSFHSLKKNYWVKKNVWHFEEEVLLLSYKLFQLVAVHGA